MAGLFLSINKRKMAFVFPEIYYIWIDTFLDGVDVL